MKVSFTPPEQELAPYVALIWIFENSSGIPLADSRLIVPDGRAKILISYKSAVQATINGRHMSAQAGRKT